MMKKITLFVSLFITLFIITLAYLSFFGFETDRFNKIISNKVNESYPQIELKLNKVKLLLKPLNLKINVITENTGIKLRDKNLKLKKISTNYNIVSFFNKDFGIRNLNFETEYNNFEDILKFARSIKDSPQLLILDKISNKGKLYINGKINIDRKGKIKNNYLISGEIKDLSLDLFNNEKIKNINFKFNFEKNNINLEKVEFKYFNLPILSDNINLQKQNENFFVNGNLKTPSSEIDNKLINKYYENNNLKNLILSSNSEFSFNINKKLKLQNTKINSSISIENAEYYSENKSLRKILPNIENKIIIKNNKLNLNYNNDLSIVGKGNIYISKKEENIFYDIKKKQKNLSVDLKLSLNETPVAIKLLDFYKNDKTKAELKVNFNRKKNKLLIRNLSLISKKNKFIFNNFTLNNKSQIIDLEKIKLNYQDREEIINDLSLVKKKDHFLVEGKNFSINSIIENILFDDSEEDELKLFTNKPRVFKIKFKGNNVDKEHIIYNLLGEIVFDNNKITKLSLNSKFKDNKNVSLSIVNKNGDQITTFYSDFAKPFVKKFKFIKGFEEGKINYSSTKQNKKSNSQLNIYDFKLKELPALTKILTLASLQGISDTLTGEGVRFNEFEMIFSNEDNLMKIEEMYSIGPAMSILMEGYVQKDKLISLKGTLVPATTINKFVSSIPLIGDVLVGKKTGEGVFGVSFKIKGPPKNLKTSVNPIKTLTPRFITRTLEKIKKTN